MSLFSSFFFTWKTENYHVMRKIKICEFPCALTSGNDEVKCLGLSIDENKRDLKLSYLICLNPYICMYI